MVVALVKPLRLTLVVEAVALRETKPPYSCQHNMCLTHFIFPLGQEDLVVQVARSEAVPTVGKRGLHAFIL